jgi:hypothetical protein
LRRAAKLLVIFFLSSLSRPAWRGSLSGDVARQLQFCALRFFGTVVGLKRLGVIRLPGYRGIFLTPRQRNSLRFAAGNSATFRRWFKPQATDAPMSPDMRYPLFLLHGWIVFTLIFTVNGSGGNALLQSMADNDSTARSAVVVYLPDQAAPESQEPALEVGSKAPVEIFHRGRNRLRLKAAASVIFARVDLSTDFLHATRRVGHRSQAREHLVATVSLLSVQLLI